MQELELFLLFCRKFGQLGLEYMVTGSVATILYGEPRLTHDIDIVLLVKQLDPNAFAAQFPLDEFYCPPEEVLLVESKRFQRGHFNLIHHESGFKADVYIASNDPFYKWAFSHVVEIALGTEAIRVAPPEYVIISKLAYYREGRSEKHLGDIRGMVQRGDATIDWATVTAEAERKGLTRELSLIRGEA